MTDKSEKRVSFIPAETFTGWPDGFSKTTRKGVDFVAGVESIPVPQSYLDLMREKELVADKPAKADAAEKSTA
jgi:hypothetical protein